MDILLKKRIVGFLILGGIMLLIIPLFFGRSIPLDELKSLGHAPVTAAKSNAIDIPIPVSGTTTVTKTIEIAKVASTSKPIVPAATEKAIAVPPAVPVPLKNTVTPAVPIHTTAPNVPVQVPTPAPTVAPISTPPVSASVNTATPTPSPAPAAIVHKEKSVVEGKPLPPATKTAPARPLPPKVESTVTAKAAHKPIEKRAKPVSTTGTEAWAVQLGSFSDKANVEKLTKKLKAQGFLVYTRDIKTAKGGNLIKVLVGPLHHAEAEQAKVRIQKALNIQGILIKQ